jgi:hypothetical protein
LKCRVEYSVNFQRDLLSQLYPGRTSDGVFFHFRLIPELSEQPAEYRRDYVSSGHPAKEGDGVSWLVISGTSTACNLSSEGMIETSLEIRDDDQRWIPARIHSNFRYLRTSFSQGEVSTQSAYAPCPSVRDE